MPNQLLIENPEKNISPTLHCIDEPVIYIAITKLVNIPFDIWRILRQHQNWYVWFWWFWKSRGCCRKHGYCISFMFRRLQGILVLGGWQSLIQMGQSSYKLCRVQSRHGSDLEFVPTRIYKQSVALLRQCLTHHFEHNKWICVNICLMEFLASLLCRLWLQSYLGPEFTIPYIDLLVGSQS